MYIDFLGGAMEVGASCILLRLESLNILMDSGIRQGGSQDPLPDFRTIQECGGVDAIIVSHAHMDHIGSLPIISKAYPAAPIYMTQMSQDLVRVLLYDSLKLMDRREDEIPQYSQPDVEAMLSNIRPLRFQSAIEIAKEVVLTFYPAGHIAGAACVHLQTPEGTILYTGDFSGFSQQTIEGAQIPKLRPDIFITESTYGNRLHSNRQMEEQRLVQMIQTCIQREGKVLIPAFALGRSQEVLLILRKAIQNEQLPHIPVYVDGMVRDINLMYHRNPTFLKNNLARRILKGTEPFYTKDIVEVPKNADRDELLKNEGPCIFVSSSGMLSGGPSVVYAKELVKDEKNMIILTGYQDEEAPGRALLSLMEDDSDRRIKLDGAMVSVNCQVECVGLSAHADQQEIVGLVDKLTPRHIILVHGDSSALSELSMELSKDYRRHIYTPILGECVEITLHTKRKQLKYDLPYSMQQKEPLSSQNDKLLWEYWNEHYEKMFFTIEQVGFIWYGKKSLTEEVLQELSDSLQNSVYFKNNPRRLFQYQCCLPEEIEEALQPKQMTQQDLEEKLLSLLSGWDYKKISYHMNEEKVIISFDFPKVVDNRAFSVIADSFNGETGFVLELSESINHNACQTLLFQLFGTRYVKYSYFQNRQQYSVSLTENAVEDQQLAEQFTRQTGLSLVISNNGVTTSGVLSENLNEKKSDRIVPENGVKPVEQNFMLSCVDASFSEEKDTPYKKSIKSDDSGKVVELCFLSPEVGYRYKELIQTIANQTGWSFRISEQCNQVQLMQILVSMCQKYNITPMKNPSYMPKDHSLALKLPPGTSLPEELCEEYLQKTGCRVIGV